VRSYAKYLKLHHACVIMNATVKRRNNKKLKPVPADKKKSLGKLPSEVRNKMGFMKKGGLVKKSKMKKK
jgi:Tfp pilus assembly protein PilP